MSINDNDKFKQKVMKKKTLIKNTWYDWLINCISEPIRETVDGLKYKDASLFEANTPKDHGKKIVY